MGRFRATPYAKALHQVIVADQPARAEALITELEAVAAVVETVPDFLRVMVTPMVSADTKAAILTEVLDTLQITEPARRFITVVQSHYRLEHMRTIATVYREMVDRSLGRKRARIEVPGPLGAAQQRKVTDILASVIGSQVIADFVDNPELLAGFRIQVGSKVFDGSLVGQLEQLGRQSQIKQG